MGWGRGEKGTRLTMDEVVSFSKGKQKKRKVFDPLSFLVRLGEGRRILLPQPREGTTQPIKGSFGLATMPARAMTIGPQEPEPQGIIARLQERQEKGIGQCRPQEQLLAFL